MLRPLGILRKAEARIRAISGMCKKEFNSVPTKGLGPERHAPTETMRLTLAGAYDGD